MRKNSPRKWLHACLDLLPVILIPVFMIYSHRHDVTDNIQVQYKYESNEVNSLDDLVEGNIYYYSGVMNDLIDETPLISDLEITFYSGYFEFDTTSLSFADDLVDNQFMLSLNYLRIADTNLQVICSFFEAEDFIFTFNSKQLFNQWFINSGFENLPQFTAFNVIESVDIQNTDVMDSFMNHFNNTIDTHFNMGNVFNLNGVYQWFNTNIFNGNAPQVIYSVWNIALYELVMDLLFLLYGLFMWFIDMVQHLMDKPFKSIK